MWFDRFDICEAYYVYAMLWHGGKGSKEYALFSVFVRLGFRTSPLLCDENDLSENGRAIYDQLVLHPEKIRDRRI